MALNNFKSLGRLRAEVLYCFTVNDFGSLISRRRTFTESSSTTHLKFDNHSLCFEHRPMRDLLRAYCVLFGCSFDSFVNRSFMLMKAGEQILGERLLGLMMTPFYRQFVAGNSELEMAKTVHNLSLAKINLMVAPCLETDVGEGGTSLDGLYLKNYLKTMELLELSSRHRPGNKQLKPLCQTKITAHISADVMFKIASIYESLNRSEKLKAIHSLSEAMDSFGSMKTADRKKRGVGGKIEEKLSQIELDEVIRALPRLYEIGIICRDKEVVLTIDAEYSYVNQAINLFALAMMKRFNKDSPVIWNTYQGYLKKGLVDLTHDYDLSKELGVTFGAKIVRGAYLEKEREYALLNKTVDPTNESYEQTNKTYNSIVEYLVSEVAANPTRCHMIVASHNEASILKATKNMQELGLQNGHPSLVFGQIFGMAENISVPLAKAGYNVYKSVPYGSVGEVLPYLSRRANENRAVFHGARKERLLLRKEIYSRMLFR